MINTILDTYINNEKGTDFTCYTPKGIKDLLHVLGDPHKQIKSIHVAGTNGKGTTCHILASVLKNAGYKTGLFISPHLLRINERISINLSEITDNELLFFLTKADKAAKELNITITYFDILTAAALCYFESKNVDIAVIETGLGGRLDSTNVIFPFLSIITDISLDHTHILGETIKKITGEKCGIIKPGVPVITTNENETVIEIIEKSAVMNGSPLYVMNRTFTAEKLQEENIAIKFRFTFNDTHPLIIETSLFPEHQIKNSAAAAAALMIMKKKGYTLITPEIIITTMKNITIPGRFQRLSSSLNVFFDPAHNISSLNNIIREIKIKFSGYKILLIMTMMKDKVTGPVLELLKSEKDNIIYFKSGDPREYLPKEKDFSLITDNRVLIINRIKSENLNKSIILFTGTFRIYGFASEAAKILEQDRF
ncbi:MAG TPA: Mur ligase family protein [Spirochaetota bacterium]|nr:Mur ligase family protein [Spirochaetota bacterium]